MLTRREAVAIGLLTPLGAQAATSFPSRNVTLIAPFAPGASADGIARIIGDNFTTRFGRQVIVENRAGAGGTTGLLALARADPDGHVLGIGATGALVVNPNIPSLSSSFDPLRELAPIAKLIDIPIVLVASRNSGITSIADAIRISKERPGGLSYGTTGANSSQHLAVELLKRSTGANLVHVAYRGSAPAVIDVLGGQIPLASLDLTAAYPHLKAGLLVGLGVTSRSRVPFAPDIPTVAEAGVPGFELSAWIGLLGPAKLTADMIDSVSTATRSALADDGVKQRIEQLACVPDYMPPAEFRNFLANTSIQMAALVKSIGVN